ncbi:GntR family transcriptional regulator [Aquimarina sp. U1-2]|uniref:GntR family transcriptional regulator n=1 Tax=Aquimarina sp. U1-2 TaxID=2823141 RepID=UPI001AECE24D|nr:GntR family transcriptional regulator [Aquimarina sp. U1-2]MBP2830874.1 GntR family transcriptional regulator [Aquimarina sp. U1-2]
MDIVTITENSGIPKYKQIVSSIEKAIINRILVKDDKLPSLNSIKNRHSLSRDTVLTAFNELKTRGIIQSVVGKGYYVVSENITISQKIFLLFDEFNAFKEDLYNAFKDRLDTGVQVEIFFHHFNYEVFCNLIHNSAGNYSDYVIMPANLKDVHKPLRILPKDSVYILDQMQKELSEYSGIYQNFEKDIYLGLQNALGKIKKYDKVVLLHSPTQPKGLLEGFRTFCATYKIKNETITTFESSLLKKGELYIILDDQNLIRVIKQIKEQKLVIPDDIGIISYNDTLLKEIIEGGITTISTDFKEMGNRLAQMILSKEFTQVENNNRLILRKSL